MLTKVKAIFGKLYSLKTQSKYLQYTVFHHRGDSLFKEVRKSGIGQYEEQEASIMRAILAQFDKPVLLDVGANIGLMTLNACTSETDIQVHAFEPGPLQFNYLKKNIEQNSLSDRVSVYNIALGINDGNMSFAIHNENHSSGDGFVDTGRAGESRTILVATTTLDEWWKNHGEPKVNLIKIDTEGFELPILQHGRNLIESCRPVILIEICDLNFRSYGLTYQEHFDFFTEADYIVYDTTRKIAISQSADIIPNQYYYVAIPKEHSQLFKAIVENEAT